MDGSSRKGDVGGISFLMLDKIEANFYGKISLIKIIKILKYSKNTQFFNKNAQIKFFTQWSSAKTIFLLKSKGVKTYPSLRGSSSTLP